jgi:La domain
LFIYIFVFFANREYYFSKENLVKDFYLRRQMDNDGWIPVELLASFRRVRIHTGTVNVELIVEVGVRDLYSFITLKFILLC